MVALPFVFITQELQVISPVTVERGQAPPNTPLTKLYWSAHVEELKQEFFHVKAMGSATAEEWIKGLDGRGIERRNDATRWENWANASGGLNHMRNILYPGYRPSVPTSIGKVASIVQIPGLGATNDHSRAASPSASSPRNGVTPEPFRRSSTGTVSLPPSRQERTKEEVAELKATRKAEIERRALELDPPLPANILAHIPSFQAALQIITPMDNPSWDMLKPRLLAQRAEAAQREKEGAARTQRELDEKSTVNATREVDDSDWDEIQAPVRARIAGFADEIIRDGWENGDKVGRDNCSKFAAEVLTYIRKRFYAEITKDAAAARAAGKPPVTDPPQGPFTQKLTLENMKWIFDVKVKPHTERHRKEIFLCNGCDVTVRYYGFEGVIQHYAAKHTTALSIGNVVVHWRAEWPEHPPFTWEPKTAKTSHYQAQPPTPAYNPYPPGSQRPFQPPPAGPAPATAAYGPPAWSEPYPQAPQMPYPAAPASYAPPQPYGTNPYTPAEAYQPYPPAQPPPASTGQYNYNYGTYQSNGQVGYQAPQPSPFSAQYRTQLEEMARVARELWNATSNMKDTLSIVRVQVVAYHLAKRFHAKFGIPLPLSTFIDGLSNHKDMRPVRNVNGLICRVCHHGIGGYMASEEERKSYSLPQLATHFQSKHVEPFGQYGQPPEWTADMVLLPEPSAVSNLWATVSTDGAKYHLVNEAVPHLLGAEAPPNAMPEWQDQNGYYQGYQGAPVDSHPPYYGQPQSSGLAQDESTGPYQNTTVSSAQPHGQPPIPYHYTEPPTVAVANSIPPVSGYAPPDPAVAVAVHSVPMGRGQDNEGRSSQGHRQGRDQNSRHAKKNKKKNTGSRDNNDVEARKREEEAKMAEEEAERESDVIRAMWAADRAKTARKSALPEADVPEKPDTPSKLPSKPNTPQPHPRFQSRPPRDSPRRSEGVNPAEALEARLNQGTPIQRDASYRGHQLSNVTYMDGGRDEFARRDGQQRIQDEYELYDRPPPRPVERRRSRSPVYQPPPTQQHRQRSPRQPPGPADGMRYEQPPPRDYPGPALIEYEIIEYRNPDGTTWIEERPLRRIPHSETERYYRDAPPSYDRGDAPPPESYRRGQPPPVAPGGSYHAPYYEGAYSRGPPPPLPPPAASTMYEYDPRRPSETAAPPRRNEPAYYEEEYDPRFPAAPPSAPVPAARTTRYP